MARRENNFLKTQKKDFDSFAREFLNPLAKEYNEIRNIAEGTIESVKFRFDLKNYKMTPFKYSNLYMVSESLQKFHAEKIANF